MREHFSVVAAGQGTPEHNGQRAFVCGFKESAGAFARHMHLSAQNRPLKDNLVCAVFSADTTARYAQIVGGKDKAGGLSAEHGHATFLGDHARRVDHLSRANLSAPRDYDARHGPENLAVTGGGQLAMHIATHVARAFLDHHGAILGDVTDDFHVARVQEHRATHGRVEPGEKFYIARFGLLQILDGKMRDGFAQVGQAGAERGGLALLFQLAHKGAQAIERTLEQALFLGAFRKHPSEVKQVQLVVGHLVDLAANEVVHIEAQQGLLARACGVVPRPFGVGHGHPRVYLRVQVGILGQLGRVVLVGFQPCGTERNVFEEDLRQRVGA